MIGWEKKVFYVKMGISYEIKLCQLMFIWQMYWFIFFFYCLVYFEVGEICLIFEECCNEIFIISGFSGVRDGGGC